MTEVRIVDTQASDARLAGKAPTVGAAGGVDGRRDRLRLVDDYPRRDVRHHGGQHHGRLLLRRRPVERPRRHELERASREGGWGRESVSAPSRARRSRVLLFASCWNITTVCCC